MGSRVKYRKDRRKIRCEKAGSREEWLKMRSKTIGGSEAGAVMNESDYSDAYSLWCEKTGRVKPFAGNNAARLGTELEDLTARMFCEEMAKRRGAPVKVRRVNRVMFNSEYPQAHANVDREVVGEHAVLECKTTGVNYGLRDEPVPRAWYWQLQHYMAVGNYGKGYLAVLDRTGKEPLKVEEVPRCDSDIERLMRAEAEFRTQVETDTRPPRMSGIPRDTEVNRERWPHGDPEAEEIALAPEYEAQLERRSALKASIRQLEKEVRAIDAEIQAEMGNSVKGSCGKYSVSWKEQAVSAIDSEALKRDHPQIRPEDYRVRARILRVNEKKAKGGKRGVSEATNQR